MQKTEVPLDVFEVDFDVVSEDWTRCKLKDGTTIRLRIPIMKIFESKKTGPLGYPNVGVVQASVIISAFNVSQVGPASEPNLQVKPEDFIEEVEIIDRSEREQVYRTKDGLTIRVKPILVKVFKAKVFNQFGEPVYQVQAQGILNVERKP